MSQVNITAMVMDPVFWLALFAVLGNSFASILVAVGVRRMGHIRNVSLQEESLPSVSIVIPACNEGDTMTPALESILNLDYPNLEVIVVNDRSTDHTAEVLEKIKSRHPDLSIYTLTELPPGWLGKSHALQYGAEKADGEYILFTDADVIMEKTTLKRAMHHVLNNRLDHLSMLFGNLAEGGLLQALSMEIGAGLLFYFKPWKVKEPGRRYYMGVGAFNLVRATAYEAVGGHRSVALQPIDDVMLGRLLKERGFRQDCLLAHGFVDLKWYSGVGELVRGLMKNVFAVYNYRITLVLVSVVLIFLLGVMPLWAGLATSGPVSALFLSAVLVRIISFGKGFRDHGFPVRQALWSLVTPYIQIYIIVRATVSTLANKGITWRGTYYSLDDLRQG